jgi:hypothetical protein
MNHIKIKTRIICPIRTSRFVCVYVCVCVCACVCVRVCVTETDNVSQNN